MSKGDRASSSAASRPTRASPYSLARQGVDQGDAGQAGQQAGQAGSRLRRDQTSQAAEAQRVGIERRLVHRLQSSMGSAPVAICRPQ